MYYLLLMILIYNVQAKFACLQGDTPIAGLDSISGRNEKTKTHATTDSTLIRSSELLV